MAWPTKTMTVQGEHALPEDDDYLVYVADPDPSVTQDCSITLPTVNNSLNRTYVVIKFAGSENLAVNCYENETFADGTSSYNVGTAGTALFYCDGGQWYVAQWPRNAQYVAADDGLDIANPGLDPVVSCVPTGVGSMTIPAGELIVGQSYRLRMWGKLTTDYNEGDAPLTLLIGGTAALTFHLAQNTASDKPLFLDAFFVCISTGAETGGVMASGMILLDTTWAAIASGNPTVDTTLDTAIDVTISCKATAEQSFALTIYNFTLERVS